MRRQTDLCTSVSALCLPFFHCFPPVGGFSAGNGFSVLLGLVTFLVACSFRFHVGNGLFVEYGNGSTTYCFVQFFFSESLARLIEIADVKLVIYP